MTKPWKLGGLTCAEADDLAPMFVVGGLTEAEAAAVRDHLAECPEPHAIFAELGGTAAYLAELPAPLEPSPAVRDRLMASVAADMAGTAESAASIEVMTSTETTGSTATTTSTVAVPQPAPVVVPIASAEPRPTATPDAEPTSIAAERERRRPVLRWVLAAAAVLVIAALLASNVLLQQRVDRSEQLAGQLREAIVAAGQPGALVATVAGTEAQPDAGGFMAMTPSGSGYLVVDGLAALPPDQVYEAWAIGDDGVPQPAGLATPHDGLVIFTMAPEAPVSVVALTIEPAGGSSVPTMPIQAAAELGG